MKNADSENTIQQVFDEAVTSFFDAVAIANFEVTHLADVFLKVYAENKHAFAQFNTGGESPNSNIIMQTTDSILSINLAGTGGGSVNSSPQGAACTDVVCVFNYPLGTNVILAQTPDSISTFGGWGVDCTGMGACSVTMKPVNSVTATFNKAPKAMNGDTGYDSLFAAYVNASPTATIIALDSDMPDIGLTLNLGKSITLKGGYKAGYSGKSGLPTTLKGVLTIVTGSLAVEDLIIK